MLKNFPSHNSAIQSFSRGSRTLFKKENSLEVNIFVPAFRYNENFTINLAVVF